MNEKCTPSSCQQKDLVLPVPSINDLTLEEQLEMCRQEVTCLGDQKIFTALVATSPGKAMRQYPALQKLSQIPLYMLGDGVKIWMGLPRIVQPCFQVMLHRLVGCRMLRPATLVYAGYWGRL